MVSNSYSYMAELLRDPVHRKDVALVDITNAKLKMEEIYQQTELTSEYAELIYHVLKYLRNSCIQCKKNQDFILESDILGLYVKLMEIILDPSILFTDKELLRKIKLVSIQLLGNLVVQNESAKMEVWRLGFPMLFFDIMTNVGESAKDCLCMVIYNCMKDRITLFEDEKEFWLMTTIIEHCNTYRNAEWGLLVLELVILSKNFKKLYQDLIHYPLLRASLLDVCYAHLLEDSLEVPEDNLMFLAENFETKSSCIIMLAKEITDELQEESLLLFKVLSSLCVSTAFYGKYEKLRSSERLLTVTVGLLKQISLSDISSFFSEPIQPKTRTEEDHPAHGFKRDLIRMTGNICYRNRSMQDKIRELDGIVDILNACNIDDRNPFGMQWAIFAIRNVCENNVDNQAYMRKLEKQGLAQHEFLTESNVTVKIEDGRIKINSSSKMNEKDE